MADSPRFELTHFVDVYSAVLLVDESEESKKAQAYLNERQVKHTTLSMVDAEKQFAERFPDAGQLRQAVRCPAVLIGGVVLFQIATQPSEKN